MNTRFDSPGRNIRVEMVWLNDTRFVDTDTADE